MRTYTKRLYSGKCGQFCDYLENSALVKHLEHDEMNLVHFRYGSQSHCSNLIWNCVNLFKMVASAIFVGLYETT